VFDFGAAPDRLGGEGVSNRPSAGAFSRETLTMHEVSLEEPVQQILAKDSRYHHDSYFFIRDALDHTKKLAGKKSPPHVSGQQLLEGIREFALSQFGPMAITVFEEWGIKDCKDFGEIVFNLVDNGVLAKNENDKRSDFANGYDFREAFQKPFRPSTRLPEAQADGTPDSKPEQTSRS